MIKKSTTFLAKIEAKGRTHLSWGSPTLPRSPWAEIAEIYHLLQTQKNLKFPIFVSISKICVYEFTRLSLPHSKTFEHELIARGILLAPPCMLIAPGAP